MEKYYDTNSKSPKDVLPYSHDEVTWICCKGHKYNGKISDRTKKGHGCPYCSGRLVIVGETDLLTVNPELAAEWHPTKNGDLLPSQVLPHINDKVWWLGKCDHEWDDTINSRSAGQGCPYCANKKVLVGFNDLQTKNPE